MLYRNASKRASLNQEEIDYLKGLSYQEKINILQVPDMNGENVTEDILEVLAEDPDFRIRSYVAGYSKTPVRILSSLADDDDYSVLIAILYNKNTPSEVIDKIVSYGDEDLNTSVVTSPNISVETLERIFDEYGKVVSRDDVEYLLELREDLTAPILRMLYKWYGDRQDVAKEIVKHPNTPDEILLATIEKDMYAARSISFRKNLSREVLTSLLNSKIGVFVGVLLENNKDLDTDLVDIIYRLHPNYARVIVKHPNISHNTLLEIVEETKDTITLKEVLSRRDVPEFIKDLANSKLLEIEKKEYQQEKLKIKDKLLSNKKYPQKILDVAGEEKSLESKSNTDLELLLRLRSYLQIKP